MDKLQEASALEETEDMKVVLSGEARVIGSTLYIA